MEKKVLLIADDEAMNRMIIKKFLKYDYEVIEAVNGREALDILRSRKVDVLLLDIIMPEMDGLEVLELMRSEAKLSGTGVLVASSTKEKTERTALSLGADDIVSKPYDPVVIKKRLENILAMKEIEAQKEYLRKNDMESYVHDKNVVLLQRIETAVYNIVKFADIINANKSNMKLVGEITDEIRIEAKDIIDAIAIEE